MNETLLVNAPARQVEVGPLEPGEEGRWDAFVQASPEATFFHLSGWSAVVKEALGRDSFHLVARTAGGIGGVLPLTRVRNRVFGDSLVSSSLAVYGGICAAGRESYFGLLEAAGALGSRLGVKYVELRHRTEPFATGLPGRDLYVTFVQDLAAGPESLLQKLPRDTRYAVRKSQKAGLEWVEDLPENEFYEIYAQSVHRLGTPVFPRRLFGAIRRRFPRHSRFFGVRKENKTIAAVLCLYFKDQVLPYYGGALPEANRYCGNNFMYWNLIAQSCREGYRWFDFGRSKKGTGSYQFKSAWSMQMEDLPYRYRLVRAAEIPHLSPVDPKFQAPIAIWRRLPFSWTKVLGPRVVRWIPSV